MNTFGLLFLYMIISWFICCVFIKNRKKRNQTYLILSTIILVLFFSFRSIRIGIDLGRYYRTYSRFNNMSFFNVFNNENSTYFLYDLLNWFCNFIHLNYQQFLSIVAVCVTLPTIYLIYKKSSMPWLSILIYLSFGVFAFNFTGLKQSIAMSFIVCAFMCALEKKLIRYIIFCVIGILFHSSAIVFLPMYYIINTKLSLKKMVCGAMIYFVCLLFNSNIAKVLTYVFVEDFVTRYTNTNGIGGLAIFFMILTIVYLLFIGKKNINETLDNKYLRVLLVMLLIQFMASFSYGFTRLNLYFIQFLPIIITHLIDIVTHSFKLKKEKILIKSCIVICLVFLCNSQYYNSIYGSTLTLEYKCFWEESEIGLYYLD